MKNGGCFILEELFLFIYFFFRKESEAGVNVKIDDD